jgi:hypothetical protein
MLKKGFLVTLIILSLLAVITTSAIAKDQEFYEDSYDGVYELFDCGEYGYDFIIMNHESGQFRGKQFYSKEGYLTFKEHISGRDVLFNSEYPEKQITGKFVANDLVVIVDETEDYWTRHGLSWHLNYPGYGNVLLDAGHVSIHWTWVGPGEDDWDAEFLHLSGHYTAFNDDFEEVCAILAE